MTADTSKTAVNGIRTAIGVGGTLAVVVGVLILVWPGKTAIVVTAIIAIYAIAAGLAYAGFGVFTRDRGGWSRVGHIVLGLLFVVAGAVALTNLSRTAVWLAVFVGILVAVMWIVEGIVALSTLRDAPSMGWSIAYASLSIVAGVVLLFAPAWGVVLLWWILGFSLVVLGIMNIVRAFRYGSAHD
ncbi:HdeD family acid-resistance protein [Microbacterium aoyamense]|uniref:HdeD family acid-resistance protein n=1 Tax=Microbacterium aoyamense TaxID=344166 RepID=A0ABP5AQG7_9MICO|nr:DUF308 domain-containing protein [Microbacterium aoyamense]